MNSSGRMSRRLIKLYRLTVSAAILWTVLLTGSLSWNIYQERRLTRDLAAKEALATLNKDQAFRFWATKHGGVYVPPTRETPPNPYLGHVPDRDIRLPSGKRLTLMNPAYILRQTMSEYADLYEIKGHLASLKPLNPINAPDEWERKALQDFAQGTKEVTAVTTIDGKPYLRLMRPMIVQEGCLKCHASQGYKVGDIRGGVGVSVPMAPYFAIEKKNIQTLIFSHFFIWLLGTAGMAIVVHRSREGIKDQYLADEAVRKSEERFRNLVETTSDWVWETNEKGIYTYVSPRVRALLGYDPEELLGKTPLDLMPPEEAKRVSDFFKDTISSRKPLSFFESTNLTREGRQVVLETSGVPFFGADGKFGGYRGINRDVTERKRTEEEKQSLYDKIQEEADVSRSLLDIVETLNKNLDEKELIRNLTRLAPHYLKFDRAAIFFYDEDLRGYVYSGGYGFSRVEEGLLIAKTFWKKDFADLRKLHDGEAVVIENALESDIFDREMVKTFNMRSVVLIPISFTEKIMGVISGEYKSTAKIEKKEISLLKGLADGLAIAYQNSRFYKESVEKQIELFNKIETIKAMSVIDREILSTIDKSTILKTATGLIGRIIPCERTAILLREKDVYRVLAEWGIGEFMDKTYDIKGSHFEVIGLRHCSLFIPDLSEDRTGCAYHRELGDRGIKSALLVPLISKGEVIGLLDIDATYQGKLLPFHISTVEGIASQITVALENARLYEDLEQLLVNITATLISTIDAKSPWTMGHSARVTEYAVEIAQEMGLKGEELEHLRLGSLLHDIGKIGTYDVLLQKPGKLTGEEFELVKKHPTTGADMLGPIKQLTGVIPAIRYHHERFDGSGYPDGLKGEDIPLAARIICVADSYDSMTAERPYGTGPGKDYAILELRHHSGTHFDPKVVEAFLRVLDRKEKRAP
jgi:PAS domain S-box-containing protein/putative nucleotidyltransferase with HDIG domain